MLAEQFILMKM